MINLLEGSLRLRAAMIGTKSSLRPDNRDRPNSLKLMGSTSLLIKTENLLRFDCSRSSFPEAVDAHDLQFGIRSVVRLVRKPFFVNLNLITNTAFHARHSHAQTPWKLSVQAQAASYNQWTT